MKTIPFLIFLNIISQVSYSQNSNMYYLKNYTPSTVAEDPYNPNWDWEKGDLSPDGVAHYWIYFQTRPNAMQEYAAIAPWYQSEAWAGLVDRKKEDGWILLTRDFGTPNRRLANGINPYFVLYNTNRSIIRVFILLENMTTTYKYSTMEMHKYENGGKSTGVLAHLAPIVYAMDKVSGTYNNATSSVINTLAMKERWVYADFPLAFDKDLVPTENTETPSSLQFEIFGTNVDNIVLETKGFGAQGDKNFINAFMKNNNFDAPGFSFNGGTMPQLNLDFQLPNVSIKATSPNWKDWLKFFGNLSIDIAFPEIAETNPFKGLFDGWGNTLFNLSSLDPELPVDISGLDIQGLYDFFVGGGMKHNNIVQTAPTYISSHYSSTGSMTSTERYATINIPLPAARLNYKAPMLGAAVGLVRNDPVGLLTFTKTPRIYQRHYWQDIFNEYGSFIKKQDYFEYEIAEDIQYKINDASNLTLQKIDVSIVSTRLLIYNFSDESKQLARWCESKNQRHLLALETPVSESNIIVKSIPVPAMYAKGRTIQVNQPITPLIKIKATLVRKDDPSAQPVVFIATYKTEVIDLGLTDPLYVPSVLPTIPPQNVKCTVGSTGVTISWDVNPESNITYYAIERSINGGAYSQIGTSTTPSFVDAEVQKAVKPYQTYRQNVSVNYRVRAKSVWLNEYNSINSQLSAYSGIVNIYGSVNMFSKVDMLQVIPESNSISQNFPNPFNPTTTIYYGVKDPGNVTVKVFNALGQEIITLVNETKEVGYHYVEWNAANMPSGVYFYKIQNGNYTESKKMVLTK